MRKLIQTLHSFKKRKKEKESIEVYILQNMCAKYVIDPKS